MKYYAIAALFLAAYPAAAQELRVVPADPIRVAPGFSPSTTFAAGPDWDRLQCEQSGDTTAVCTCNNEPSALHQSECLALLRQHCPPVRSGEAICETERP